MDKISVIIPCHNAEPFIDRCLESVVSQTIGLDMLEIIVINDVSTDGTLKKLYEWEERFPDNILCITYEEHRHLGGGKEFRDAVCHRELHRICGCGRLDRAGYVRAFVRKDAHGEI